MSLLLEADPNVKFVNEYLQIGDLFGMTYKKDIAGVAVVAKVDEYTCELKNIAIKKQYRGMGDMENKL